MFDHPAFAAISRNLHARSAALLVSLEGRLPKIMLYWLGLAALAAVARIAVGPLPMSRLDGGSFLPYVLLVLAPAVSLVLALHWFSDAESMPQPETRLARVGTWRDVSAAEARKHPLYGTTGIMVSLLIGMLLNVPVRAAEYLATMPAINSGVPGWLTSLHFMMTVDAVLMSSLYVVAFVAALRRMPLFPRFLLFVWLLDLAMQLMIAEAAAGSGIPAKIADPLLSFLDGNVRKVMISIALWLPYLLLSRRVNVTYRHRLPA